MHRNNCFDIIRLVAALMVLYSHHFALSGFNEPVIAGFESPGGIAVILFFAISGFLISQSGLRSGDFASFMAKRCRRIFPALIPCSIFVFVIIGSAFHSNDLTSYLSGDVFYKILQTVTLQNANSRDLTDGFIYPSGMLGSLWSLPVEFACYLVIGLVVSVTNSPRLYPAIFASFLVAACYVIKTGYSDFFFNVPVDLFVTRGMCFFLGASMSMSIKHWNKTSIKIFSVVMVSIYLATATSGVDHKISGYILFTIIAIFIGVTFNDALIKGRFDYSYGIYIYAFPVQQLCINTLNVGFYTSMILSTVITITLASLSWHFVEKRFLFRSKRVTEKATDSVLSN
ncbi:acyltransferase [Enterobacter sp.]|uniref:acyltransferase family protein n=2 Tax=Enterobacter sp. TaxID=42895 RepID=UPI00296EC6F5|nr:acyltransferase [Enterobacter sp.]